MPNTPSVSAKRFFSKLLEGATRYICLFAALTLIFLALILAAYAVPESKIEKNARAGMALLEHDSGGYWPTIPFKRGVVMDYRTDARMLEYALREEGAGLLRASQVPDYARYWHGYQVYLRPGLALGTLQDLRWVNTLVQYAAICLFAALAAKRLHAVFALCFGAALAMVDYLVVPYSFQFSGVFLVMLGASITLLAFWEKPWFKKRIPQFFFTVGAATVFMDLLTAPVITLGVPLVLLVLLRAREKRERPLRNLWEYFCGCVAWAGGYVALWFSKWMISGVVLRRNEIWISIQQILFRTGASADGYISIDAGETAEVQTWDDFHNLNRFYGLGSAIKKWVDPELLPALFAVGLTLCLLACLLSKRTRNAIPEVAPLLAVAFLAPLWLLALGQHSAIHAFFAYRNLLPTGLALLCLPCALFLESQGDAKDTLKAAMAKLKKRP